MSVVLSTKLIISLVAIVPLLSTSIYSALVGQNITSSTTQLLNTDNQIERSIVEDDDDQVEYFLTLTSGYRIVPIYERKGTFAPLQWGWGHDGIPINGSITNFPFNQSDLFRKMILIEGQENDELIFKKFVTTDRNGTFHASFFPPTSGSIKIMAMMLGQNSTESIITVIVTESALPIMVIALLIIIAIILILVSEGFIKRKWKKWGILVLVAFFTIAAYIILFKFPPFDEAGNTAFAAALLAPIAAYFYQVLTYKEPAPAAN